MTPHIYITHHVRKELAAVNDFVVDVAAFLERMTPTPHQLHIVVWHPPGQDALLRELRERMSSAVEVLFNDRPGRPDTLPSMRNKCVTDCRQRFGADALFVLLENDIRVSREWLGSLLHALALAEASAGAGNVVMHPRYCPYWWVPSPDMRRPDLWQRVRMLENCKNPTEMALWCQKYGVAFQDGIVSSYRGGFWDDGHALMMFATRVGIFDTVGLCDEDFVHWGWDDDDWGMRVLAAGKKNYCSQGAWIGHLVGLTFYHPATQKPATNKDIFIAKWGQPVWGQIEAGTMWPSLRKAGNLTGLSK